MDLSDRGGMAEFYHLAVLKLWCWLENIVLSPSEPIKSTSQLSHLQTITKF